MIVECKSMDVQVNDSTLFQAATYNKTIQAPYLVVTNGMKHLFAYIDWTHATTQQLESLPIYPIEIK
jgi:hypothetical protein